VAEAIGAADSICSFLEVITVAALVPLVVSSGPVAPTARAKRDRAAAGAAAVAIALLTALAARAPEPVERTGHHALGTPAPAGHAPAANRDA
jgi:hypothetical protein